MKKIRNFTSAAFILLAYRFKAALNWLRGKSMELPNYTLIEPNLYIGGRCAGPPPKTSVVLNLSANPDEFFILENRWRPVHAGNVPDLGWLREQVDFVNESVRAGKTIFVHCDAGIDRSALVVVAYLMFRKRWTRDRALEYLQRKRSAVRPNPTFIQLLYEWEGTLGV